MNANQIEHNKGLEILKATASKESWEQFRRTDTPEYQEWMTQDKTHLPKLLVYALQFDILDVPKDILYDEFNLRCGFVGFGTVIQAIVSTKQLHKLNPKNYTEDFRLHVRKLVAGALKYNLLTEADEIIYNNMLDWTYGVKI